MPQATRAEVYAAIDSERDYQDDLERNVVNKEGDPTFSPMTNLCIIDDLSAQMKAAFYKDPGHPPLDYMRKIAAVAARSMEAFGAPERVVLSEEERRKSEVDAIERSLLSGWPKNVRFDLL